MRDLQYQLKKLCDRNRDGSFGTRAQRGWILSLCAAQLWEMGYRDVTVDGLKGRHVHRLLALWQEQGLSPGTVKNRMGALRWWLGKFGHEHYIPRTNATLGIAKRAGWGAVSRAQQITPAQLHAIRDRYVRVSVELQREFGLRREEAIKFQPTFADRGDHLVLKSSWCKGGRPRTIPILTAEQRHVLKRAWDVAGTGALIPPRKSYVQQLRVYEYEMKQIGMRGHGLRHGYAQARYAKLSGQKAPHVGGPVELTEDEQQADQVARMQVSAELGHRRKNITNAYLGAIQSSRKKKEHGLGRPGHSWEACV